MPSILQYKFALPLVVIALLGIRLWRSHVQRRAERVLIAKYGCQPLRLWNAGFLGIDLLSKAFRYAREGRILSLFLFVIDQSGMTFEQSLLGVKGIDTIDPENLETILSKNFTDYDLGLRKIHFWPLMGSGIFTQDGAEWKHSRELMRPQFMSNRLQNFNQIKECVANLISAIPQSGSVDLQPLFFRLTFDTTTYLLFGRSMGALNDGDMAGKESEFAEAFNIGQDHLAERGRMGDLYWLLPAKRFRKACKTCHTFVDEAVSQALDASKIQAEKKGVSDSEDNKNYVFIEALLQETRDPKVLRDQCLNILLAGRDTTACCISWAFRLLTRHQSVLAKLRTEIESVAGIGPTAPEPTISDLKKMTYLNLVIKEVLRLYPSVPVNTRAALRPTILPVGGGSDGRAPVLVHKGEAVGYCVYAMHRRKDIYGEDAMEFRPERWENGALKDVGYGYLPFNGGPRVWPGQDFAVLEAGYTIARIIQMYPRLEVSESEAKVQVSQERQTLTLVVSSAEGCKVQLGSL